jgi:hypothetical protein
MFEYTVSDNVKYKIAHLNYIILQDLLKWNLQMFVKQIIL